MNPPEPLRKESDATELSRQVGAKAKELFVSGRMLCTPAVVTALNHALGGGLDPAVVNNLTAGIGQRPGRGGLPLRRG